MIAAWVAVRVRMHQSPLHLWLGSAAAAVVAVVAHGLEVNDAIVPVANFVMVAASLFAGFAFTFGVRCEAKDTGDVGGASVAAVAASLALALLLELTVTDAALRTTFLRAAIALEYIAVLVWIPELLRSNVPKPATTFIAILAALVAIAMLTRSYMAVVIVIGTAAMLTFSASRARAGRLVRVRRSVRG